MTMRRRLALTLAAALLALLGATGLLDRLVGLTPLATVQEQGLGYLSELRGRATASYLTAFGLNAIVSFAQSAEVSAVVVSTEPGQLLDPVDDLVEQFSDLMLFSAASIGVQELIHQIGSRMGFVVFLPLALALLAAALWLGPRDPGGRLERLGRGLLVLALLAKLAIPLIALTGGAISNTFLIEDYRRAEATLQTVSGAIEAEQRQAAGAPPPAQAPAEAPAPGLLDRLGEAWGETRELLDGAKLMAWQEALRQISDEIITLFKIFVVETIVLPVAFGWGLYRLVAGLVFGR
ncbi:MAG TPA: hypothetical protein VEH84_02440 [Alphaproteobacteria bacterium]|nr:hypothetical protein [Alphaproteobacteria bacterium]